MRIKIIAVLFCLSMAGVASDIAAAQMSDDLIIGLRGGVSSSSNEEDFTQIEAYAVYRLPWSWVSSGWTLATELETTVGVLTAGGDRGAVISVGPGMALTNPAAWFVLRVGVNPTFLSEDIYGDEDLGGQFHFTSHISLDFGITPNLLIGYRFHHISNAGIEKQNPGVDVNFLQLSYSF